MTAETQLPDLSRNARLLLEREPHLDRITGRRLAKLRESRDLTIPDLAALTGIQADELQDYEAGRIPIAISRIRLIAAILDLHPMDLFTQLVCPGCSR